MTLEQEMRLNLLSDGLLYQEANAFAKEFRAEKDPTPSQLNGLLAVSQSWGNLERYVNHQAGRNWQASKGQDVHPTKAFYDALKPKLAWLKQQAQDFLPEGLTKNEVRDYTTNMATHLAREFTQHLVAELLLYRGKDS